MIEIERLAFKLNGINEHDGYVLAAKIREALTQAAIRQGQTTYVNNMKIRVERQEGESMDNLSKRIVANLLSQIEKNR